MSLLHDRTTEETEDKDLSVHLTYFITAILGLLQYGWQQMAHRGNTKASSQSTQEFWEIHSEHGKH
jgi:hypothetical protein